ncbi:hypothetical protein [Brevibacterium aurantiacum]|uniref:Uncharacterized protein n=1 Tax=Brevibacterium aurantiacum TaxID=273384 RepID=A0A2A3Z0R7_BREAU|nr:hypothetical protein [Brevibacterium aurantiacum]PCC45642.1 hypothetical protein CIK64_14665 [Brevibacterium aurantiacum]
MSPPLFVTFRICPELDTEYTFPGSQVIEIGLAAARAAAEGFVSGAEVAASFVAGADDEGAEVAGADIEAFAGAAGISTMPMPERTMTNAVNAAHTERTRKRVSGILSSFRYQTISPVAPHDPVRAHDSV